MVIENCNLFTPSGVFAQGGIRFKDTVRETGPAIRVDESEPCLDAAGGYVIPGLVDIHTHGAVGHDVCDASAVGLSEISHFLARSGVTSFCATTMTLPESELVPVLRTIAGFVQNGGARCVGVNLEGPFISREKCGAQPAEHVIPPDIELFGRLNEASGGNIRLVDIAPECDENFAFTRAASRKCSVSFAHSNAGYELAMQGFASGARHATHLFNAMSPYHQFDPGLVGATIDSGAWAELICDGHHVHPSIVRTLFRLLGPGRLCLVSDSLRCAGMPDGEYTLAGQRVFVQGGCARLANGLLAGSSITLMEAVRRAVSFGVPLEQAVAAATCNPAAAIGMEGSIGTLAPGARADLVVLDKALQIKQVFIGGKPMPVS